MSTDGPNGGDEPRRRRRRRRQQRSRLKRYVRKCIQFLFSHVGLAAVSVAYMVAGAMVFKYVEAPHESDTRWLMNEERIRLKNAMFLFIYENDTRLDQHYILEGLRRHFVRYKYSTISSIKRGYDGRQQLDNIQWSFSGAFFYSLTTISTVGYGNIACRTTVGRAITIGYSILGIPLMLLFLAITGDTFSITCKFLYREYVRQSIRFIQWRHERRRVRSALSRMIRAQLYHTAAMYGIVPPARVNAALLEEGRQEVKAVTVPMIVLISIMIAYLVAGATLFSFWEGWTFEEGFYFCFISLALIGFGDLFPGAAVIESWEARNKIIICAFYLLCGMALIAMCFNLAQEDAVKTFTRCAKHLGFKAAAAANAASAAAAAAVAVANKERRGSTTIDPRDIILEGGPIGGADETPPLTVGDLEGAIRAVTLLTRQGSAKRSHGVTSTLGVPLSRRRRSQSFADRSPSVTAALATVNELTRLLMPNGNPKLRRSSNGSGGGGGGVAGTSPQRSVHQKYATAVLAAGRPL